MQSQTKTQRTVLVGKYKNVAIIAIVILGRRIHPTQKRKPAKGIKQIPVKSIVSLGKKIMKRQKKKPWYCQKFPTGSIVITYSLLLAFTWIQRRRSAIETKEHWHGNFLPLGNWSRGFWHFWHSSELLVILNNLFVSSLFIGHIIQWGGKNWSFLSILISVTWFVTSRVFSGTT